jgi:hypothetical protein
MRVKIENPITAPFASHFQDALSQAKLVWYLICTRQGSNLQPYGPKSSAWNVTGWR